MPILEDIEQQAHMLADENRTAEPTISRIFWFPDVTEVRLLELTPQILPASDGKEHPVYFRSHPASGIIAPSGIALTSHAPKSLENWICREVGHRGAMPSS